MSPALAKPMFDRFVELVRETGVTVATGEFGAQMSVAIANDGPLTLIVDSKRR
jgi:D-tyrosyl-tRNA(Tyr) deacylase